MVEVEEEEDGRWSSRFVREKAEKRVFEKFSN
jgi:hypothetical protein